MRSRGRLEPRTAIDHCESVKIKPLGITVDGNNRFKHWEALWNKDEFAEFRSSLCKAQLSLRRTIRAEDLAK
uniref:Uncharacterized protein n=1 Tax=Ditylenchus dipsaci TaxID=166011 RepID=A0A915CS95_9BILA